MGSYLKNRIIKILILSMLFCCIGNIFCQNVDFEPILDVIEENNPEKISDAFNEIKLSNISDYDKATWHYYKAYYLSKTDDQGEAYKNIVIAKKLFLELEEDSDVQDCNFLMLEIIGHQNNLKFDRKEILDEIEAYVKVTDDPIILIKGYNEIATSFLDINDKENSLKYFRETIKIAEKLEDNLRISYGMINISTVYKSILPKDIDSSLHYIYKAIPILIEYDDSKNLSYAYNNLGKIYNDLTEYDNAIKYYLKADSIPIKESVIKSKIIFYENIAESYKNKGDFKNELYALRKLRLLNDSINDISQNIAISEIKEQYGNEKLRADNLEQEKQNIEQKAKTKQITIGLTSTLALGSIIAFLVYRNTKRKQHIAEQDRELQIQKTETILKEKEIETINAMVSGQEKERLRLASELHDNLGSTLATVRMQVENLERNLDKVEDPKELLQKTNALVNEAYDKVRKISHERNSGVIAKDGLLPAIQKLARTVSNANNLTVDVQDFGLENRIANELEITIFRIIQELVTNIIKHAQASEASISLTQHDNELNIMVEDNGRGFKVGKLKEKEGMGLGNIERRIEHLEGSMEVDSNPGRGTSISIDIPL